MVARLRSSAAAGWPRWTRSSAPDWDIFNGRPRPSRARLARAAINGVVPSTVDAPAQAYAEVERITRREARNFAYGIMVLPKPKRQAIAAVYAFARRVDDIADGGLPIAEKRARLEQLHAALDQRGSDPF